MQSEVEIVQSKKKDMGLSIHYNGRFNTAASLKSLIEEVADIARVYKWKHHIFHEEFPVEKLDDDRYDGEIYGILFSPPECEPVFLTFLSNGLMCSPQSLDFWAEETDPVRAGYLYQLFTKTQYAGIEIHKLVIHILKHISQKYLSEFSLIDEGEYWETGDEILLQKNFDKYNFLIDSFCTSLETFPKKKDESFEVYFMRLMKNIKEK